ncbi:MAG: hypothetical protein EZS28_022772 [Streblomastix strix]|uniref:Uncharacterized protein n=1 Tax=Streblomastix strix TaxID=222440 RepID=A0A5J4VH66_9EUKA|nr:MAG: hypothetical protein EZS28_022772 [Streblomastix strix]
MVSLSQICRINCQCPIACLAYFPLAIQVRPVGLTYSILLIIPPFAKSQVIGIYVPFATPLITTYVNFSVIQLIQQVLQSDTTIVIEPADSILTYAEQIAEVQDPK